jgi:uncharacterized repeat protein (TIGR01451 family)
MRILTSLSALLLAVSISAHAAPAASAAPGAVEVKNVAEVEVEVVDSKGNKTLKRQPVEKAVPGTEVIYTTTFKNLIAKPVGNIAITNPVPNNTTYKAGSATGANTDITFSIDGGKAFAAPDKLKLKDKDGKERSALPAEYTHIRWTYKGELPAGKGGEVSFRTVIK